MIVRIWEGRTILEHSEAYKRIITERDIPYYQKTEGFVKLVFLERSDSTFTNFKLLTFWKDLQSIKNFTGQDFERAVSYNEDEKYLVDFPGTVLHYGVFAEYPSE